MMIRLPVCSALNISPVSAEDPCGYVGSSLAFFKEQGFDGADLAFKYFTLTDSTWLSFAEVVAAESRKLEIPFLSAHLPYFSSRIVADEAFMATWTPIMHRAIDTIKTIGIDRAVIHPNTKTAPLDSYSRVAEYDKVMALTAPFAEYANKVGVTLALENMPITDDRDTSHRYCQEADELCEVADALGIGVCWDIGHSNISAVKHSDALSYIGKRLKVIHLHDNNGVTDDHAMPFTGTTDWQDVMEGLTLAGFTGALNFEVSADRIPQDRWQKYAQDLQKAANRLQAYRK